MLKNINKYEKMRSSCCCEGIPCMHIMQRLDVYVFVKINKIENRSEHGHTHPVTTVVNRVDVTASVRHVPV